jgi:uncharacterized protein
MPSLSTLSFLALAATAAGFVDACVGSGGLITMPVLLITFPGVPLTALLGTNKASSTVGTSVAALQFLRSGAMRARDLAAPMLVAALGSVLGVRLAFFLQGRFEAHLRPAMVALMVLMLAFTLLRPELGSEHAPRFALAHQRLLAALIGLVLGLYDGFFGPGAGSILIFLFVTVLGFDFLRASALAKAVNWSSNLTGLLVFLFHGSWVPVVALTMAVGNGIGGYLGARTALSRGSAWVRLAFILVVGALILKLGYDVWSR